MTDDIEMGARVDRDVFDVFGDELEPSPEPQPSPAPQPKCRALTVVDLLKLTDRPMTNEPAPAFAVEAMTLAAVRVMARPGAGSRAEVVSACAALISAPVPTLAQALLRMLKTERTFSVAGLIEAVDAIRGAAGGTDSAKADDTAAMQKTPDMQVVPD